MITLSDQELTQAQQAIEAHLVEVRSHPHQRAGAHPYYRFHPPGKSIYGTVLIFHGFSMRPHQMSRLADYLFDNGFNFYQVTLAGHDKINPQQNWPQIDLKPAYAQPLLKKVQQDPVLQAAIIQKTASGSVALGQQAALIQRLFQIAPEIAEFAAAIDQIDHPDFEKYFISSHTEFLKDAQQRLDELSALSGPIYTVGLSVGGAVALGLAEKLAERGGDRIERVVAYAPLLKIYGENRRRFVQLTGPLDINETGWDPNLRFPVGALTAADYFGSEVRSAANVARLASTPVFITLTENEDAADIHASEQFFADLGGRAQGNWLYKYPASAMVPHAMVDPMEISQGMSNLFWQGLYQETLRFLRTGEVNLANLETLSQDDNLPLVHPVAR
jgi:alpha-beta hydrolase superfamily lysophospholipase